MARRGRNIGFGCLLFAFGMLGAAYASVPLYELFCQVTGYGGTTQRAEAGSSVVLDRTINVRFDANSSSAVPWTFQPVERQVTVKLGETRQTAFRVRNNSDKPIVAQATFNVTPLAAGVYFNKLYCFCFDEQTLQPGEDIEMPIVFFVDPAMLDVEELKSGPTITLSYTLFPIDTGDEPVAAVPAKGKVRDQL
ncbi:cytochrome c oxidase assembly protein [Aureimonas fodinaquatilis]|uniref:Cytochrome c oxidase assembly protein CtaG n=1 Tax=Aureimonas fodinaquatilis TaxID=2565783 RepID=A0A5B0E240_9HYPH|nr:cytochrome c oxidase assembly protein [Aureimonas fodinaquatilis]KAA0972736.1 cytochrome c oxidase assembly protein [Aureimonas fodinaquatilis]